ncbi:hypothetical protein [Psychroflexus salis]|uniref:Uncharacterized protein n=1 Tax=Psychroflexus salis TaxID=1526574 RepID=A0A916ZV98_9FLAO|nr:hypothetical protein [Psychroflexus salis]GGE15736.1 hypothetical protein GCM10010831_16310 [Psychroflexus salis]
MKIFYNINRALHTSLFIILMYAKLEGVGYISLALSPFLIITFLFITIGLVFVSTLTCFAPIRNPYDLSIIFPELPPIKKNVFTIKKFQRFTVIFREISDILIYLAIAFYFIDPAIDKITFILFSVIPKAIYFTLIAFVPQPIEQDLGKVFPELKV